MPDEYGVRCPLLSYLEQDSSVHFNDDYQEKRRCQSDTAKSGYRQRSKRFWSCFLTFIFREE